MLLALAALLAVLAAFRPLAPGSSPWLRLVALLLLAVGVVAAPLLAALRSRGTPEQLALYAFLLLSVDAFGQLLAPLGWPIWPAMALIVAAIAVAEPPSIALGAAALAAALAVVDAAAGGLVGWKAAVAASLGYCAIAFAVHAGVRLRRRLAPSPRCRRAPEML